MRRCAPRSKGGVDDEFTRLDRRDGWASGPDDPSSATRFHSRADMEARASRASPVWRSSAIARRKGRTRAWRVLRSRIGFSWASPAAISWARASTWSPGRTSPTMPNFGASSAWNLEILRSREVAAPVGPEEQGPHDLHAVARHEAGRKVGSVLEVGVVGGEHDVAQHSQLRVDRHRAVDRGDHRYLDVEHLVDQAVALPDDAVPHGGVGPTLGQRVAAVAQADEGVAGPGEDHDPVLPVGGDGVGQFVEPPGGRTAREERKACWRPRMRISARISGRRHD